MSIPRVRNTENSQWTTVVVFVCLVLAKFVELRSRDDALELDAPRPNPSTPSDRTDVPAFDADAAGIVGSGGPRGWLFRFLERRHWRWAGRALQIQQRFSEVRGNELAASVTLVAFLSLFPLALVAIAVLGFLQANSADFADRLVDNLGLTGAAADQLSTALDTAAQSRQATSVIGVIGLLWAGLGFTSALRLAFNTAWQVPDRGMKDKAVALVWVAGAGALFAIGAAVAAASRWLPAPGRPLAILVALAVGFGFFLWTSRILPNVDVGWRPLVGGALVGAVGLVALQILGAYVIPRTVGSASALYGTLGVVFAILAWLVFFGRLLVYVAVVDVVLYEARAGTVVGVVEMPRHSGATRATTRAGLSRPSAPSADLSERPRVPASSPGPEAGATS